VNEPLFCFGRLPTFCFHTFFSTTYPLTSHYRSLPIFILSVLMFVSCDTNKFQEVIRYFQSYFNCQSTTKSSAVTCVQNPAHKNSLARHFKNKPKPFHPYADYIKLTNFTCVCCFCSNFISILY